MPKSVVFWRSSSRGQASYMRRFMTRPAWPSRWLGAGVLPEENQGAKKANKKILLLPILAH